MRSDYQLSRCEKCGQRAAHIIEIRHTLDSTRRRKECRACGHRFTTLELPSAEHGRLTAAATALTAITAAIASIPPAPVQLPCPTCKFATATKCSMDYPEFMTEDAIYCSFHTTHATTTTRND